MSPAIDAATLLHILDASRRLIEMQAFEGLLRYILNETIQLVRAERGFVILSNATTQLDIRCSMDRNGAPIPNPHQQVSSSIVERVVRTGEPMVLSDALDNSPFSERRSVRNLQLRSIMCVPLISYGKPIGALYVENRSVRGMFREENVVPLAIFGAQAAVAIENAAQRDRLEERVLERTHELQQTLNRLEAEVAERRRMEQQLRHLASTDSLTGVLNRRAFLDQARISFDYAKSNQTAFSLMMMDMDRFKRINDQYGHSAGDQVLLAFVRVCQPIIGTSGILGRVGGEEFGLILPGYENEQARDLAEQIRQTLVSTIIQTDSGETITTTISIGVASMNTHDSDLQHVLNRADRFLYQAKEAGRNCVIYVEDQTNSQYATC